MCNTYAPVYTPISTLRPVMQSPLRMSFGRSVNHTHRDLAEADVGWQLLRFDGSAWALACYAVCFFLGRFFLAEQNPYVFSLINWVFSPFGLKWVFDIVWSRVVVFSVYLQGESCTFATPCPEKKKSPWKMATLQKDGNWNPSIWDHQSKIQYLSLHSCCSFQPLQLTILGDVTRQVARLHPGIYCYGENEEHDHHLPARKILPSFMSWLQRKTCLMLDKRNMQTIILNV